MIENRSKLSDMGQLSAVTYEAYGVAIKVGDTFAGEFSIEGGTYSLFDSYTVKDYTPPTWTDMQAILLERNDSGGNPTGEYVVAFRGTEPNSARDWITNGLTGLYNFNPQVLAGKSFVQEMMGKYSISADHLTLTGHSLGGIITQAVGAELHIEGYSFNPYGANLLSSLPPLPLNYLRVLGQVLDLFGLGDKNDPWIKENLLTISYQDGGSLNGDILSNLLTEFSELIAGNDHLGGVLPILGGNVGLLDGHGIPGLNATINRYNEILAKFTEETTYGDLSTVYLLGGKNGFNSANQVFDTLKIENMPDGSLSFGMLGYSNEDGNLLSLSPTQIEKLARTNVAYRYALVHGNPFAVMGANYNNFNQNGELDLYDPTTGKGQLTNMYLADRSEYLANLLFANINDTTDSDTDVQYVDLADKVTLNEPLLFNPEKKIAFGSDGADLLEGSRSALTGDDVVDRLYGMAGNDNLSGFGGADYLEGGADNDILNGGRDNDILDGGTGLDTYIFQPNSGHDILIDSDRKGRIMLADADGKVIDVATGRFARVTPGVDQWTSASGNFTLTHDATWVIKLPDGSTIDLGTEFSSGDFGIDITEPAPAPVVKPPVGDDNANLIADLDTVGQEIHAQGERDMVVGSTGSDLLDGGSGDDWIIGRGDADTIEGGSGNDLISWIGGGSVVNAGAGDDIVAANMREWFYISHPNSPITADAVWADVSSHWQAGHADGLRKAETGEIIVPLWGGAQAGTFSGDSALGDGWTYEFTLSDTGFELVYTHPTEAPDGIYTPNSLERRLAA